MSEARSHSLSLADFLIWEREQERRYEFVGGQAVMMTGGTRAHALIAANIIALLRPMLRGSPCLPFGSDLRVPIPATGNCRYPDVTIDCGRFDPAAYEAAEPTVVFEVLSKSTGWYDQTQKVLDYASVSTVRQYICVSQSELRVSVWLRHEDGRLIQQPDVLEGSISIEIGNGGGSLFLVDIYESTGSIEMPRLAST